MLNFVLKMGIFSIICAGILAKKCKKLHFCALLRTKCTVFAEKCGKMQLFGIFARIPAHLIENQIREQ